MNIQKLSCSSSFAYQTRTLRVYVSPPPLLLERIFFFSVSEDGWTLRMMRYDTVCIFLQVLMSRRVKKYLANLTVITNEDELRELSLNCEPPPGSGRKHIIYYSLNSSSWKFIESLNQWNHCVGKVNRTSIHNLRNFFCINLHNIYVRISFD